MLSSAEADTEYVTVGEAARRIGCDPRTVRRWMQRGLLAKRRRLRDGVVLVSVADAAALRTASVPDTEGTREVGEGVG